MSVPTDIDSAVRLYPVPSDRIWFDPALISVATYPQITDIVFGGAEFRAVAPANVNRWGIGFFVGGGGSTFGLAPWPDVQTIAFDSIAFGTQQKWYNLFTFGPLVCSGWYMFSNGFGTIRVVELIRRS